MVHISLSSKYRCIIPSEAKRSIRTKIKDSSEAKKRNEKTMTFWLKKRLKRLKKNKKRIKKKN